MLQAPVHLTPELPDPHDELAALANHQTLALESGQLLSNAGTRGAHQVGEIFMTQANAQQDSARIFDSKISAQIE